MNTWETNARALAAELHWLTESVRHAVQVATGSSASDVVVTPPPLAGDSWYGRLVGEAGLSDAERLITILALAPELGPGLLDQLRKEAGPILGGRDHGHNAGLVPTVQTALFALASNNLLYNLVGRRLFDEAGPLRARRLIRLDPAGPSEPLHSAALLPEPDVAEYVVSGRSSLPAFGEAFPARRLETRLEREDLILPANINQCLAEIGVWLDHNKELLDRFRHVRPGFRALFYGPPGTGKTLAAALLGKERGLPVYRLDLSQVVSKYIGETEKNLERIFSMAQDREWILFFDEADALFAKRGDVNNANDRYANQGTAYLLQRLESFPGLVILATNLRNNLDKALARRLNLTVYFPLPDATTRRRIWETALEDLEPAPDYSYDRLASEELSGGQIVNVVARLALGAIQAGSNTVSADAITLALEQEHTRYGAGQK